MKAKREGIGLAELTRQLNTGAIAPIYLVIGEESFLREAAVVALRGAVFGPHGDNGFNYDLLYGDEADAIEILNVCSTLPAFAERRLVMIREVGGLKARECERMLAYLKSPVESTCLVLTGEKVDGRIRFFQALKGVAVVVDCGPLESRAIPEWLHVMARQLDLTLDEVACEGLQHASGGNLAMMVRELEKLAAYLFPGKRVTIADVEAVRGADTGGTVWDLLDALGRKDRARAVRALGKVLDAGEPPLRLLGLLTFHWRQIWRTREQLARRVPEIALARILGVPPFRVRSLVEQARRFPDEELARAFKAFRDADGLLKGGSRTGETLVMERLVLRLCRGGQRAATSTRVSVPAP
jgi:DNA polymerase III subunit delta